MPTHESPAEQDLSSILPDVMRSDEPVHVRHQTEGPLLSFSQEELKEKIRNSEQSLQELLAHIGIPPEHYTAEMIAAWTSADPNILDAFPLDTLPEMERRILESRLWGCVGKGQISIPDRWERYSSVGVQNDQLLPGSAFTRQLRERILFEKVSDRNEEPLKKLQEIALNAQWKEDPVIASEWIERLHAEGRDELVRFTIIPPYHLGPEPRESQEKRNELAARFPWLLDIEELPAALEESATVDGYLREMEDEERRAVLYDAYKAVHPGIRRKHPYDDPWDTDDEERPSAAEPQMVSHPLEKYRGGEDPFTARMYSYDNIPEAVAAVRFAILHPETFQVVPEGRADLRSSMFHRTLGIFSRTPREDIPEELMRFLIDNCMHPDVVSNADYREIWPQLAQATNAAEFRKRLEASCFRRAELDAVVDALPEFCGEEWILQATQESRLVRAVGAWLSEKHTAHSAEELRALTEQLIDHIQQTFEESGTSLERDGYERWLRHPQGGGSSRVNTQWLLEDFAPGVAWIIKQHRLPFGDAYKSTLASPFGRYRGEPIHDAIDRLLLARTDATVEELWEIVEEHRTLGVVSCRQLVEEYLPLFRKAFLTDIPRFTAFISECVIAPLAKSVAASDNASWDRQGLLRALETMACFDAAEARTALAKIFEDPVFAEKFRNALLWDPTDSLPALARLCASDITYPRPEKLNLHAKVEEGKIALQHLPMAWILDREADEGVVWSARRIPVLNEQAFTERWLSIVRNGKYPPPGDSAGLAGRSGRRGESRSEQDRKKTMKELRDQALQRLDHPEDSQGGVNPDNPELPSASLLSENPKTIGVLSEPLEGDARYVLVKICDDFDPAWLAHLPTSGTENLDLRTILQADHGDESVKNVSLEMRMGNDAVVPLPMGNSSATVDIPGGSVRSAGHWSKRVNTRQPVNATIQYGIGKDRSSGTATLADVLATIPSSLRTHAGSLGNMNDLPEFIREKLQSIDLEHTPLAKVVKQVQRIVHAYYEYHFLLTNIIYKERYRSLLQQMPYAENEHNEYLDFIHSLREEPEEIQGRGVCGQLSTVLEASLRSLGIPAYFGAGYCPSGTTITTNDAHAWVVVPFLDPAGKLFMKPVEATSGDMAGLDMARAEAPRVRTREEKEEKKKTTAVKERPVPSVIIDDEVEQWRRHLQSCLSPDMSALTREDIEQVTVLIQTADKLRRTPLDRIKDDLPARAPHHLIDALTPAITAMSPETRNRLALLQSDAKLSPAGHALVQYLLREGKSAYQAHLQSLKDSGYDKDLGITIEEPY